MSGYLIIIFTCFLRGCVPTALVASIAILTLQQISNLSTQANASSTISFGMAFDVFFFLKKTTMHFSITPFTTATLALWQSTSHQADSIGTYMCSDSMTAQNG